MYFTETATIVFDVPEGLVLTDLYFQQPSLAKLDSSNNLGPIAALHAQGAHNRLYQRFPVLDDEQLFTLKALTNTARQINASASHLRNCTIARTCMPSSTTHKFNH